MKKKFEDELLKKLEQENGSDSKKNEEESIKEKAEEESIKENTEDDSQKDNAEELESQESEGVNPQNGEADSDDELTRLRDKVEQLSAELRKSREEMEFITSQHKQFSSLFPEVSIQEIPDEVWESAKSVGSLAAAYALFHRRNELKLQKAMDVNKRNAFNSAGNAGKATESEYFTPQEVKKMSQGEIRANYSKIIESMKKWN